MGKVLCLYFENQEGQSTVIQISQPHLALDKEVLINFMNQLIQMSLFQHKGQEKYTKIKGATYRERVVKELL